MKVSEKGIALIKGFEGLRLNAYQDVAGIWTIGYGSTRYADGKPVKKGDKLANEEEASALLLNTLSPYPDTVDKLVKVDLTANQKDALTSFLYNTGAGALKVSSTLKLLNQGDYTGAAEHLLLWNKITDPKTGEKVVCDTLTKRRKAEMDLFLKP